MSADAHEQHEVARDELRAIGQAIDLLPDPRQRDVVRMTIEGFTTDEIAALVGVTRTNVNQLRSRALRQMRGTVR